MKTPEEIKRELHEYIDSIDDEKTLMMVHKEVSADGKNGEILLYKEHLDYVSVMNGNYTGLQYSFKKEMFINADSIIYYWKAWRRK